MKCVKCNNEIPKDSLFCCFCGADVERREDNVKIYALKCPNCDGNLEIEDGLDTFYCKYCGYKIFLHGQSEAAYRAKTRVKGMEHDERMADKRYAYEKYKLEQEDKKEKSKTKTWILIAVAVVLFYVGVFGGAKISSNSQEKELESLVEEIMLDIENEKFDEAYIKAQSIKHTSPWSDEVEEKWEKTRKEVINQIIEAEKEATGSSSHKPESDGWFDGWFD